MIINIAHTKGGVGKTTVATNLAIGMKADMFDLDVIKATQTFGQIRKNNGMELTVYTSDTLTPEEAIARYKRKPDRHLVVDSGGYDSSVVRSFLGISDLIITPLSASAVELNGIQLFDRNVVSKILQITPIPAYALLNSISHFDASDAEDVRTFILTRLKDYKVLNTMLGNRKVYRQAYATGQSVLEMGKNKGAEEIEELISEIRGILKTIK